MTRPKNEDPDFLRIKSILKTVDFKQILKDKVTRREVLLAKKDPNIFRLVVEYTGEPESIVRKYWDKIYKLIVKIYYGRVKVEKEGTGYVSIITPASALYLALREVYGADATEIMYQILEPVMTSALAFDQDAAYIAHNLFMPVSPSSLDVLDAILPPILSNGKEYVCNEKVAELFENLVCTRNQALPHNLSRNNTTGLKTIEDCIAKIKKILGDVCEQ